MNGVDLSHYQKGLTIRQLRAAGKDFAILKLTEGTRLADDAAFDFYREAWELGFPVGGYCYSRAADADGARAEAAFLLETIRGFPMPCGLFLDLEEPEQLALPHGALLELVRTWCAALRDRGCIPGVYGSAGTLWAKLRPQELPEDCLVWVARWGSVPPDMPCDLWQTSDSGRIDGYSGSVDTDTARSARFRALAAAPFPPQKEPGSAEKEPGPDPRIMVLQLLMHDDGCWDKVDGMRSAAFFTALRAFTDRLEDDG